MLDKMPLTAKVLMVKFWFAGAAYFLVCLLLAGLAGDMLALLVAMGLVNGLVAALLTNPVIRFMEAPDVNVRPWLFFYGRAYGSFCGNILYGVVLTFLSYGVFFAVKFTADPVLFGMVYCGWDVLFLQGKRLINRGKRG